MLGKLGLLSFVLLAIWVMGSIVFSNLVGPNVITLRCSPALSILKKRSCVMG